MRGPRPGRCVHNLVVDMEAVTDVDVTGGRVVRRAEGVAARRRTSRCRSAACARRARAARQPSASSKARPVYPTNRAAVEALAPPVGWRDKLREKLFGHPAVADAADAPDARPADRSPSTSPAAATDRTAHGQRHRRDPPPRDRHRDQPDPDHRGDPHAALAEGEGHERRVPARLGRRHRRRGHASSRCCRRCIPDGEPDAVEADPGRHPDPARRRAAVPRAAAVALAPRSPASRRRCRSGCRRSTR